MTTRLELRRSLIRQIVNRNKLIDAGRNPLFTFRQRYFANVMAEVAQEEIETLRKRISRFTDQRML